MDFQRKKNILNCHFEIKKLLHKLDTDVELERKVTSLCESWFFAYPNSKISHSLLAIFLVFFAAEGQFQLKTLCELLEVNYQWARKQKNIILPKLKKLSHYF